MCHYIFTNKTNNDEGSLNEMGNVMRRIGMASLISGFFGVRHDVCFF